MTPKQVSDRPTIAELFLCRYFDLELSADLQARIAAIQGQPQVQADCPPVACAHTPTGLAGVHHRRCAVGEGGAA